MPFFTSGYLLAKASPHTHSLTHIPQQGKGKTRQGKGKARQGTERADWSGSAMSKRPDKVHYVPPARRKPSPVVAAPRGQQQPFIMASNGSPPHATPITTTSTTTPATTITTTNINNFTTTTTTTTPTPTPTTTNTNTAAAHANSPVTSLSARLVSHPQQQQQQQQHHARFEPSATPPLRSSPADASMRPQHPTPHSRHGGLHRDSYELAAPPFHREVCPLLPLSAVLFCCSPRSAVLLFCCFAPLCCPAVLLFCRSAVLPFSHSAVLLFYYSALLLSASYQ